MKISPEARVRGAAILLVIALVGWPATHVLIIVTKPAELASWTGHLLLAISWLALVLTCLDILATTDTRKEVEDDGS